MRAAPMFGCYVGHVMTKVTRPGVAIEEQTLSICCLIAKNPKMPSTRCLRPKRAPYVIVKGSSVGNAEGVGVEEPERLEN